MDAGEYVPDEITNQMVRNRIDEPDAEPGFLLDGYPRTLAQVEELDGMIEHTGHRLDAVVVLTVDSDEVVQRLLQRAQTEGRADDTEDVIRRRQEVYAEETEPLIAVYRKRGLVHRDRRHGRGRRGHQADLRGAGRHPPELTGVPDGPAATAGSRSSRRSRSTRCVAPAWWSARRSSCCAPRCGPA